MKNLHRILPLIAFVMLIGSCSDILEEQPRTDFEPGYFQTEAGLQGGITSVYAHLRSFYGPIWTHYNGACGTDECTWGGSVDDGGGRELDMVGTAITPGGGGFGYVWEKSFPYINTCNGIISIGTANNMDPALIAEAKFFRAHDYFLLVQTYGGAPLDLGAGELQFNSQPGRTSKRNTVPEVYAAIFKDLQEAILELPNAGRVTGGVTKTAARFFLAKAYLTYGWWCERNSTPQPSPSYFQLAYNTAMEAINNPDEFGLMPTFYDVNLAANDRNKEIILYADHTDSDAMYNEGGLTSDGGTFGTDDGMRENRSNYSITSNFENFAPPGGVDNLVRRIAQQDLGRPWSRVAPTIGALTNTFADKTNDSRYDGTFVTTYYANFDLAEPATVSKNGANGLQIFPGDVAAKFLDDDTELSNLTFDGAFASLPGEAYAVWTPATVTRAYYPGVWKFGPDRPDKTRSGPWNAPSTRPYPAAKFSELYLIAAEAVVKGAAPTGGQDAVALVNVIRERAGKWRWDNNGRQAKVADYSATLITLTPSPMTIDFILAERSREFFAEGGRWYDLVRTGKWAEYASTYEICEGGTHNKVVNTRNIDAHHYLRPIPQATIDALDMSDAEKAAYQNPGY
ncbi:membrane protein [Bacteroidia bacterium]|nr:membrane protein [Bacteroidia bacterium]